MKKRLLPVALLLGTMAANAQVGIGTATPNKSAELLIESSNRGLLIPNVLLTSTTDKSTITNGNVQSLMVYATKTLGDITPGYYYWDINVWKRLTADTDIPQIVVNKFQEIVNKDGDKVQNIIKNIVKNTEGNVIYEGDKLYTYTKEGDKVIKQEIKDKLTTIVYDDASGDYIYYNENAVDRNGKIIGEGIRIKVKETVINKFGDIINNKTVQDHITNYLDGTHVGGNVYYEGDKLTYVTKEGDRKEVSINSVVTANESKTAIITVNKKQYYVAEEYLVANKGVVPTTVDATNLPKGIYAIDVVGGVVNNLEEIVNSGPVNVDGRTFKTVNDYITYLTESKGGFTKIVYDQSTGDVVFQEWNETTQKYVNVDNSKFSTIVKGNETVTTLLDKGDGTFTYTDEKGKTVSFDSNNTVVEISNGVYTFKDGKGGVITTIDTNAKAIGYDNSKSGIDAKNVQDALDKLADNLGKGAGVKLEDKNDGKVTLVADNGDVLGSIDKSKLTEDALNKGLFTFTRNDGTDVLFDVNTVNVSETKDSKGNVVGYDFKDSKGNVITTVKTAATNNYYDNSVSGIDAKNVQDALDKLADNLGKGAGVKLEDKNDGKVTLVADNGDVLGSIDKSKLTEDALNKGLFTFTRNDGTDVFFDVNTVNVSETKDAKDNVVGYDFKDSKGNVITTVKTAATNNYYDNSVSGIDAKNVQEALDKLADKITTVEGTSGDLVVSGGLEFLAKTTGVKALLADANIQVASKGIKTEKLDDKAVTNEKLGDKSVSADKMTSFTSDNGTTKPVTEGQIPVADGKGGVTYKEISGETLKGKALTSGSISVIGGDKALLDATKIEVTGGKNKGDVLVTTDVTLKGADGKEVLGADGKPVYVTEWVNPKDFVSGTVTAKNGVTVVNDKEGNSEFKLGGYLTEPTVIDTKENTLAIANMDSVAKGKVLENNLVIADANGVLKQTSAKNLIEEAITDGKLDAKDLTSGSIIVKGGENSLLKDTNLEIKGGTSEGQVLVSTPELDTNGKPVLDKDGKPVYITKWVNADKVGVEVTNGLKKIVGTDGTTKLGLGGTLTEPKTSITTTDKNVLAIEGLANVDKPVTDGNNLVIADKDGVLKQTSAKNLIEDAITDGKLDAKELKGVGITVTAGDKEGTETSVASSLLKDVTLGIADGAVTSDKMKATVNDGGVVKIAEPGMVPVANADGTVTYNKVDSKHVTYTKPTTGDNGLISNTVEDAINELAGKKGDLKVAGGMLTIDAGGKEALRHDATISLNLEGMNAIVKKDVDYTAKVEDVIVLVDAISKDLTVTLPDATAANKGKKYTIKKYDANEEKYVTVKGNIFGATELYTALPYSGWDLVSDGTQWQIVNKF